MTGTKRMGTQRLGIVLTMLLMCGMILFSAEMVFAASSVIIGDAKLTASKDIIAPVAGEQITFPEFIKVEAANPSPTDNRSYRVSTVWLDKDGHTDYIQEEGNPGKTFTTGTWGLYLFVSCDNGSLYPVGTTYESLNISQIQFAGQTWTDNNHTDDCAVYEVEFQVAPAVKTKIQSFTLKSNGTFQAPVVGAPITYPEIASVASTVPAGLQKQLMISYAWYSEKEDKIYYQDQGDTGTFGPGKWTLNVFVEVVDKNRYEIVWENFDYQKPLHDISLGGAAFNIGALSENVIVYDTTFTAALPSVADCTVAAVADQTYTGKAILPKIVVTDRRGTRSVTLKAGIDYTVSGKNNKSVGKAALTITGKGKYSGKKTVFFRILPKGTTLRSVAGTRTGGKSAIRVSWKLQSKKMAKKRISGYQLQFASDKKFKKNVKTVTVSGWKKTSKTVTGFKKAKKYYVRIRTYRTVSKQKYSSKWSKAKSVKVKK